MYVQLGEAAGGKEAAKPRRGPLPKGLSPAAVTLDIALRLLALPRTLGNHPDSGETVQAGIGRYGPYLKHGRSYLSLPAGEDVLSIGMNRAVEVLAQTASSGKGDGGGRLLGNHPADDKPVTVRKGRYGPYIRHGSANASLTAGMTLESVTLEEAVGLLAARAAKDGGKTPKKPARASAKTATTKTAKTKTAAVKKPAAAKAKTPGATAGRRKAATE